MIQNLLQWQEQEEVSENAMLTLSWKQSSRSHILLPKNFQHFYIHSPKKKKKQKKKPKAVESIEWIDRPFQVLCFMNNGIVS